MLIYEKRFTAPGNTKHGASTGLSQTPSKRISVLMPLMFVNIGCACLQVGVRC